MRFKATFSEKGLLVLDKGFLPMFEKFGKTLQVLLGEEEVHFVQSPLNTDGPHVVSRFATSVLFDAHQYKCQSKHCNLIAFTVDAALLLRVLRSAGANNADTLEVRLTQRSMQGAPTPDTSAPPPPPKPFLTFTGRGDTLSASEIDRLVATKDVDRMCPYYVDLQPCVPMLHSMVDRMKGVADAIGLATCLNGDVHVGVSAINTVMGTQVRELAVYGAPAPAALAPDRSAPADQQLQDALHAGEAIEVHVQQKHLLRMLAAAQLTTPSQMLCGIAESRAYVHVMYVFKDPSSDDRFDDSVHLSFRLPVKDV